MSVGLDESDHVIIPKTHTRRAGWATVVAILVGVAFYFAGGRQAFQNARNLQRNKLQTESLDARTGVLESGAEKISSEFDEIKRAFHEGESENSRIAELNERVSAFEEKLMDILKHSKGVRNQINDSIAMAAHAMSVVHRVDSSVKEATQLVKGFQSVQERWKAHCLPLLEKKLRSDAISHDQVSLLSDAISLQKSNKVDLKQWQRQIEIVRPRIERALADEAYATQVNNEDLLLMQEIITEIQAATEIYAHTVAVFETIFTPNVLDAVRMDSSNESHKLPSSSEGNRTMTAVSNSKTLRELLRNQEILRSEEYISKVSRQMNSKREAELQRRAQLLSEQELKQIAQETERQLEESRQRTLAISAEKQRLREINDEEVAKLTKLELEKEFEAQYKKMESMLKPFISLADTHPTLSNDDRRPAAFRGGPYAPMSFGGIQAATALEPTDGGLEALFYVGGHSSNLRVNIGGFPRYSHGGLRNEAVRNQLKQIQEFLRKFGPLMVEKRLLSK